MFQRIVGIDAECYSGIPAETETAVVQPEQIPRIAELYAALERALDAVPDSLDNLLRDIPGIGRDSEVIAAAGRKRLD